ncbi:hypothetical protein STSP2_00110 [Anaerohalosphaera lusitana]|uniref:DUF2959 domain-containing protein n=1 Tax=Anaerohalosphaera lusitana TaxID=1936003 RepID=A0A1U9NGB1_9BACT|nr:DUF2959 domain-containing protein [Anaerohalosphaera lusitana]AQT66972.1 hypothetical protein STSP2_00110 [Anaerohalosphaera lusitana]
MRMTLNSLMSILLLAGGVFLSGCENAYYGVMERFNVEKRDILVDRVQAARDSQNEAKDQFRSALSQFEAVVDFEGGELEEMYDGMKQEYDASQDAANKLSSRIDKVEDVAEDLFDEWEAELDDYSSDELRRASARQLRQTRTNYDGLITSMRLAEARMEPVLESFEDQVLFLKHNLNAVAIASLDDELANMRSRVDVLVDDMEEAIQKAEAFIDEMMKG